MQSEQEIKELICEIGRRIYDRGMVAANDGNLSVRFNETEILCTPTGVSKGYMTPDMICKIDGNGEILEANGDYKPSSEMKMHLRVYQKRPDAKAVVHAHPVFATTFAIAGVPLDKPIIAETIVALGGGVPVAEYGTPSTNEIPDRLEPYLEKGNAVLLEHHGALTWSEDLLSAYMKMESVEFYAQLLYRTKLIGFDRPLAAEDIDKLYEVRRKMGLPVERPSR